MTSIKLPDWIFMIIMLSALSVAAFVLHQNLYVQNTTYAKVIGQATKLSAADQVKNVEANVVVLTFSRARDVANMRAASMFVAFLLIFTGAWFY